MLDSENGERVKERMHVNMLKVPWSFEQKYRMW